MSLTINAAQLADTGFVLFVVFTCGYSLFANNQEKSGKSKKWMQELAVLQETIRELIGEASSASSQLDRTLQRRKLELEKLLVKIDSNQSYSPDMPNQSWAQAPTQRATRSEATRPEAPRYEERAASPRPTQQQTRIAPKSQAPTQRRPIPLTQQSELAKRIEVFLDDKKPTRMVAEEASDPAAYKIAKRLLESGKEIHVVAKKVGLPIEEIRVLDTMVNGISEPIDDTHLVRAIEPEAMTPPSTYTRTKQIIRQPEVTHELDVEDEEIDFNTSPTQIKRATTFL